MIAQLVMSKGKKPKKVNTKPFDFAFGVYASSPKGIRFYCKGVHSFAKGIRRRAYPSEPQKTEYRNKNDSRSENHTLESRFYIYLRVETLFYCINMRFYSSE